MKHRKKRRGGRRTRRNASFAASLSPSNIVKAPLSVSKWKNVGIQLLGLTGTTFLSTKANEMLPVFKGSGMLDKVGRVAVRFGTGSVLSILSKKIRPGWSDEILNGAMLSGVAYTLQEFFPSYFKGLGEGEDWFDYGMSDYADPRQMANPYALGDFADPRQMANPYALGDYADPRQMANPYGLGYQDAVIAEELAQSMV